MTAEGPMAPDYGTRLADIFFPELEEWRPVFEHLAVPLDRAIDIVVAARDGGGDDIAMALLESRMASRERVLAAIAAELGLEPAMDVQADRLIIDEQAAITLLRHAGRHVPVKLLERDGRVSFIVTPERLRLGFLRDRLRAYPTLAARLKLADPAILRAAVIRRAKPGLLRIATDGLFDRFPHLSARFGANAWQGVMVGVAATVFPVGLLFWPTLTFAALHGLATIFFLACVALRFAAVAMPQAEAAPAAPAAPGQAVPSYSVLVALYREAEMVPDLLAAIDKLEWPRHRLEIKLVCEADDAPTLAAIRASPLPRHVEVVEVPPLDPRTKPKALAYALPLTSGEFVALYDAEDRPDPLQLAEAWSRFRVSGPDLAVVQAPLKIANASDSIVTRMFAFEYAALFRGLLPWLSRRRLILPLGGTSNHFRRAALDDVASWDPYNVTEDADLGMRLVRFGYRAETISRPTFEDAPDRFTVWLPQRTRWFKGWSQTWLVHMRDPLRLLREVGPGSFVVAQVLFAGLLASALLHPLVLATLAVLAAEFLSGAMAGGWRSVLMLVDIVNIVCGYVSFLLLGWQTLEPEERKGFWRVVVFTPLYWAMMSVAGWRSLWQLWRTPHLWEKTPHERRAPGAAPLPPRPLSAAPVPRLS